MVTTVSRLPRQRGQGLSALEALAESELQGVDHTTTRISACEDTGGSPRAVVQATVPSWHEIRRANDFFVQRGWVLSKEGGGLTSADGRYLLQNSRYSPTVVHRPSSRRASSR